MKHFNKAARELRDFVLTAGTISIIAQVLAAFVFPILEISLREIDTVPEWILHTVYGSHVVIAILATFALVKGKQFIHASGIEVVREEWREREEELQNEREKIERYKDETISLIAKSTAVQGSLSVLQTLIQKKINTPVQPDEVKAILTPLILDRARTLDYQSDDLYNFVVYMYDSSSDQLNIFFRDFDNRLQITNRSWKIGRGHVGSAFAQNTTIIVEDATQTVNVLTTDRLKTDDSQYKSFVLSPIPDPDLNAKDPLGIFVVTSNRENHFGEDDRILIDSFSIILSILFCDRVASNSDSEES